MTDSAPDPAPGTILITGAGSGIGKLTAQAFLGAGWRVGLMGRRAETLKDCADGHPEALVLPGDVTDPDAAESAIAAMAERWGRIDVLFNNAGLFLPAATIDEISVADWQRLARPNIDGMFLMARAAFAQMRRQTPQGGRIINNGSISAHVPRWGSAPYTMSKHAVTGLTKALSLDGRAFGIACGQIDVGNALTDMVTAMTQGVPQADGHRAPEPVMDARHVADAVLHMAGLPLSANVQFMTVMATAMPFIGRG
ncbi:SDR family NAD(P)-dependent oxidoreductase [Paracoccus sp. Z118]|uniref:SDR family oxidoreductase n=1 Tax=Paracoccus sp. Z118 TaxID=2851017 RepID=UPI001C2C2103|nr:SDR family NAD(P)-dependent oxidoreductase [Paracoccus sp. Z118]MBV0891193.1 SDR family NAD(P)-dependent oxidoreductase [Paracoccus sp. Z118]